MNHQQELIVTGYGRKTRESNGREMNKAVSEAEKGEKKVYYIFFSTTSLREHTCSCKYDFTSSLLKQRKIEEDKK